MMNTKNDPDVVVHFKRKMKLSGSAWTPRQVTFFQSLSTATLRTQQRVLVAPKNKQTKNNKQKQTSQWCPANRLARSSHTWVALAMSGKGKQMAVVLVYM